MELQKVKHELKVEEWRRLIYECRTSGQTICTWCKERHISPQTYYRWQRAVWDAGTQNLLAESNQQPIMTRAETAVFTECRIPASVQSVPAAVVTLHFGNVTLEFQNGVHSETVETILRAVKALC